MNHRLRSGQSRREAIRLLGVIGSLHKNSESNRHPREVELSPPAPFDGSTTDEAADASFKVARAGPPVSHNT